MPFTEGITEIVLECDCQGWGGIPATDGEGPRIAAINRDHQLVLAALRLSWTGSQRLMSCLRRKLLSRNI
jgi:hypothetical protein